MYTEFVTENSNYWLRDYSLRTRVVSSATFCPVIGDLLKTARLAAGLTQEELAEKAQLTREYVSLLERDKRTPTIQVFIRITRAARLSPADLIQEVERRMEGERR